MTMLVGRVQRGEPFQRSPNSPAIDCKACDKEILRGTWLVEVPLGPGDHEENRDKLRRGFEIEPVTVLCHYACVTGWDTPGPSRLEKVAAAAALQSEIETFVAFQKKSPEDRAHEVALAAQGLRDPSLTEERYVAMRRQNIEAGIKLMMEPSLDARSLVEEYGGSW